jgi:biopolymer transport protein ExbD
MINIYHRYEKGFHCDAFEAEQQRVCRDDSHWKVGISGVDHTNLEKLKDRLKEEADKYRTEGKASDRRVMLRAEKTAPYGHIQDVMNACAGVGIYQIECGAARPADKAAGG